MDSVVVQDPSRAIAVYCGSSIGNQQAFRAAAISLGKAMVDAGRPLVYGGGDKGIMGVVSSTVAAEGGFVTGVIPSAMVAAGGEGRKGESFTSGNPVELYGRVVIEKTRSENTEVIIVESMHERKVEMARRASAFIGLPGGFGTFEEVMEVVTWTQLRIHKKAVLVLNVLNFYSPLRDMVESSIKAGFILAQNRDLLIFVDGPEDLSEHESFDWGKAAMDKLDEWSLPEWEGYGFKWAAKENGHTNGTGSGTPDSEDLKLQMT